NHIVCFPWHVAKYEKMMPEATLAPNHSLFNQTAVQVLNKIENEVLGRCGHLPDTFKGHLPDT
ncbi:MAG: hypothetical protein J7J98_02400, partial [candidate division Zixibacteria bacterium]|nr:hypothetical protein [candidate division Zixibacteria bacterium]